LQKKAFSVIMLTLLFTSTLTLALNTQQVGASEPPPTEWSRPYGGTNDEGAASLVQTSDGGYALAGETNSFGAGGYDFWLVKTDASGNVQWSKTYGGTNDDRAFSVVQTVDGGYALAGQTYSYGAGGSDFWLVKTDASGNMQWSRPYGGTNFDSARSVVQTVDGGYALAGGTRSFGAGNMDFWLVKTDSSGNMQWSKPFGGSYNDYARSVVQTVDGGYALGGYKDPSSGLNDFWLVKTDASGNMQWSRTYGGTNDDMAHSVVQTVDGGYALAGETASHTYGKIEGWLVKTDAGGNMQWSQAYGMSVAVDVFAYSLVQSSDAGYALGGQTWNLILGDPLYGTSDFWLAKTDANGNMQWNKTIGGTAQEYAYSVVQTSEGGHALAGWTNSFGAGKYDFWLVKIAPSNGGPPDCGWPVLVAPVQISSNGGYSVGDTLTARFTIQNQGTAAIHLDKLLFGGRFNGGTLPGGGFPDFSYSSVTLQVGQTYQYEGTLYLTDAGYYQFFVAYYIANPTEAEKQLLDSNNWNTCIDLAPGLTDNDRTWSVQVYAPTSPDFSVTAQPSSLTIPQGSYSLSAITITSRNGFSQPVNIEVYAPYGVEITLLPTQVTPQPDGSVAATLIVSVSVFSTVGSFVLTVTGTSGALTHTTYLSLEITKAPSTDWTFAVITDIHMGYYWMDYGLYGWDDSGGWNYPLTDRLTTVVNWINSNKDSNNIRFVVVLGDISDSGEKSEFIKARDILNGLSVPYIPVIGNHDIWPYVQDQGNTIYWRDVRSTTGRYPTISGYSGTAIGDQYFNEVFWQQNSPNLEKLGMLFGSSFRRQSGAVEYEYIQNYVFTYEGIKFIALDFIDRNPAKVTQSSGAKLNTDTEWWLSVNLSPNEKTILLSHHPMFYDVLNTGFSISQAQLIGQIIKDSGAVVQKNFAGHTHRNAESKGMGTSIQVVTTEAICRESCSINPLLFGDRSGRGIRLVTMSGNAELKDYENIIPIGDSNMNVPHPLYVGGMCPIDLIVTDPDGFTITKENEAVAGMFYLEDDWDHDGDLEDLIFFDDLKPGNYQIHVIPELGAMPNDTYTLEVFGSDDATVLAENASIGDIPAEPFIANSTSFTLNVHPTTLIEVGEPKIVNGITYVSPSTPLDFNASDNAYGSGLASIAYRIYNATFDTGWTTYTKPIYLLGLSEGTYQIDYNSTDCAGNIEPTNTATVTLKNPNISVTDITLSKTIVGQGFNIRVNVTVQNLGMFSENFTNTLYANTTAVGTQKTRLASNASTTMAFTWNTSSFARGNFTITAYAEPMVGETTTVDNAQSGGIIIVTVPGDVNTDGIVDMLDVAGLSAHWYPGPPQGPLGFDPNCDINGDGLIDIIDAGIVSAYWTGPPKGPLAP
jgi:predicted secreted protein